MANKGDISDGYHTFDELYDHRNTLFIALMVSNPEISWRANFHHDGTMYEDWFIAGMHLSTGDVSYHLPLKMWGMLDVCGITTLLRAPEWVGHASNDVIDRISRWSSERELKINKGAANVR